MLEAIVNSFRLALEPEDPGYQSSCHMEALDRTERRLLNTKQETEQHSDAASPYHGRKQQIAELYRLAGLIYLYRAGRRLPSTHPKVRALVASAIAVISEVRTCPRAFPIVIIGCEARCDADRCVVLDLLRETARCRKIQSGVGAHSFIEAAWAQDDLCGGGEEEIGCARKLDAVMSLSRYRPSFAVSLMGGWDVSGDDEEGDWEGYRPRIVTSCGV